MIEVTDSAGTELDGRIIMRGKTLFVFAETGVYKKDMTLELLKKT
ncbi:hypothetical protein [Jeotgalibacillus malaysiensis]